MVGVITIILGIYLFAWSHGIYK